MKSYRFIILCILAFALNKPAQSTHIVGGELIYECLFVNPVTGQSFYRITVKLYRECTGFHYGCQLEQPIAAFDSVIHIAIYDFSENLIKNFDMFLPPTDTLENNTYNLCLFAPPDICVEEAIFQDEFFLDTGPFYITYQRCCRNWDIENIVLPPCPDQPDVGASWFITIPDTAIARCNSSAYFNNYPPTIICVDDTFKYDHSAIDPDGDSLVYELCAASEINFDPLGGGAVPDPPKPPSAYFDVPYISPNYSATYPIFAPVDSFKIDRQTGYLTGTPTKIGLYVVAVCVSEYRNGVLLSTNKRDFQFNVAQCVEEVSASFIAPPSVCDNLTVNFTNTSNSATYYFWDFGDTTTETDISTVKHATYTYPGTGTYTVSMIVNATLSCADTASKNVYLYDSPTADAGEDDTIALGESVAIGGNPVASGGTPPYTYLWTPGNTLNDPTLANPFATPSDTLVNVYTITVTDANGCQNIDVDTVRIHAVDARVVIPSAFTPDNNGRNDTLFLLTIGIKKLIDFKIFNRWGEVVYESQNLSQGWDGNFKGTPQEIGRYVYYFIAETITGSIREGKGDVALLR